MAKEVKKEAVELTVEEKLKTLYQLQTILSEIDKIKTLRGELPLEVQDLEDEVAGLKTRMDNYRTEIDNIRADISARRNAIETATALVERYKEQQNNVRNNREYETLTKEIEYKELEIELDQKRIREGNEAINSRAEEIEKSQKEVEERSEDLESLNRTLSVTQKRTEDLEAKKAELESIVAETKQQEEKLRERGKELELAIEPRLLTAFKRIRKNSRNGLGIVTVQRDACGGCFNKIPPQKQMDIRMRKKIIVCEYCGRIMIDPELAGFAKEEPKAAKKRTRAKKTEE